MSRFPLSRPPSPAGISLKHAPGTTRGSIWSGSLTFCRMARIASRNFTKHCFLATWIFNIRNLDKRFDTERQAREALRDFQYQTARGHTQLTAIDGKNANLIAVEIAVSGAL